jgi:guanylate kinase
MGPGPLLVVLTGPSGAGKDSLLSKLRARSESYHITVNVTTRAPRPGEQEGVDYYFVSKQDFGRKLRDGELLEHAVVYGQEKGVPRSPIRNALASGQDVLLRTDIQGARTIKRLVPGAITIFVAPPSEAELKRRVRERGGDSEEQIRVREEVASQEMGATQEFDYTVVNHELERCVDEIEAIIARERSRPDREPIRV